MYRALLPGVALMAVMMLLGGCEQQAADKEGIRSVMVRIAEAYDARDGETVASLFTAESLARYGRLVQLGLNGSRNDVLALNAWDVREVLSMRLRAKRKDLKDLDPRAYVVYAVSHGWYDVQEPTLYELRFIRVRGDEADADLYYNDVEMSKGCGFMREGGVWKFDQGARARAYSRGIDARAAQEGVPVAELLLRRLEEITGIEAPPTIWDPMK